MKEVCNNVLDVAITVALKFAVVVCIYLNGSEEILAGRKER